MAALNPHPAVGATKTGPGQRPPSKALSARPAESRWRTADSGQRRAGCRRPHGKPCRPMRSIPRESTPASSPHPGTSRMSSGTCGRTSWRRREREGICGTSPQAQLHTQTPPRQIASVDARTPAAPTPPRHAAPQEPCAPHNMKRLTPRPAAPHLTPRGVPARATLGPHAGDAPCRHSRAAQNPGRDPIRPACRRTPQTTATCTRPGRARPRFRHPIGQRPPAEPPGSRLSPLTRPSSPPAVTHRCPLPSQPPPPKITPNPAQ